MNRGFTLIEMLVSLVCAGIILMATFAFASVQMWGRKGVESRLEAEQNARVTVDSIRADLQTSGLGAGYDSNGVFFGLVMGSFGPFDSDDFDHGSGVTSDDIRIRGALGPVRTIASDPNGGDANFEVCAGGFFSTGDTILMVDESYTHARAVDITGISTNQACTEADCVGGAGCDQITFVDNSALFAFDLESLAVSYSGGSAFRGFFDVVYFIDRSGPLPNLYRADWPCGPGPAPANRAACMNLDNLLAEGVEALEMRVLEMDDAGVLIDQTQNPAYLGANGVAGDGRVRIDVEVVARSRQEVQGLPRTQTCSAISGQCFPTVGQDQIPRTQIRTSAELKNSGMMRFDPLR